MDLKMHVYSVPLRSLHPLEFWGGGMALTRN